MALVISRLMTVGQANLCGITKKRCLLLFNSLYLGINVYKPVGDHKKEVFAVVQLFIELHKAIREYVRMYLRKNEKFNETVSA